MVIMSRDNALRNYVISQQQMFEGIKVRDIVNDLRCIKKYKKMKHQTIYSRVRRQFERKTLRDKVRKRTRTVRTKSNISSIKRILQQNNECTIREIQSKLKKKILQYHLDLFNLY